MPINFDHSGNLITTSDSILSLEINGALKVPVGTTSARPVGSAGYIRYNTSLAQFEGFNGTEWISLDIGASLSFAQTRINASGELILSFYDPGGRADVDDFEIDEAGYLKVNV